MAKRSGKRKAVDGDSARAGGKADPVTPTLAWTGRDWVWALALALGVLLIYSPVWGAGYIWDDDLVLTRNPVIVGPLGLNEIWTTSNADICPFTLTTFWVEHALWGLVPLPYHVVNVLFHVASAVVLWRVLLRLRVPGAWLGAALWAVHPVEVQSAAWIAEMKNTESALFFLLTILFFLRWLQARDLGRLQPGVERDYGLTLLFAALAMGSKSSTVILPVVLCLGAWWAQGQLQWRTVARIAPVAAMSALASLVSLWTQGIELARTTDPQWVRTWPERFVAAGDAVWFYLGKLVWPSPLIFMYPRWQIDAGQWISYLPLLAVLVAMVVFWLKRESWARPWFFVFAYFVVALLPALGLADNYIFRYSLVFDHFQYLASMAPLALVGAGVFRLTEAVARLNQALRMSLCAAPALVLAFLSWQQSWIYQDSESLWTDTLVKNPTCWTGHYDLGNAYSRQGKVDAARVEFQKAVELNPTYVRAYNNLGIALCRLGRLDEGLIQFQKALTIKPNDLDALSNFGKALLKKGEFDEAIVQLQKALQINPNDAGNEYDLSSALDKSGRMDEAKVHYQRAQDLEARARALQSSAP